MERPRPHRRPRPGGFMSDAETYLRDLRRAAADRLSTPLRRGDARAFRVGGCGRGGARRRTLPRRAADDRTPRPGPRLAEQLLADMRSGVLGPVARLSAALTVTRIALAARLGARGRRGRRGGQRAFVLEDSTAHCSATTGRRRRPQRRARPQTGSHALDRRPTTGQASCASERVRSRPTAVLRAEPVRNPPLGPRARMTARLAGRYRCSGRRRGRRRDPPLRLGGLRQSRAGADTGGRGAGRGRRVRSEAGAGVAEAGAPRRTSTPIAGCTRRAPIASTARTWGNSSTA